MFNFRSWIERLFGLQETVKQQLEQAVREETNLAGAVMRARTRTEGEAYARELDATNPELAAAIRAAIAEHLPTQGPPAAQAQ